jgi:hypothetical protein
MATHGIRELYDKYIRPLPTEQKREIIKLATVDVQDGSPIVWGTGECSLLELEGLGKEIWEGVDAQEYVNRLREEWKERPW